MNDNQLPKPSIPQKQTQGQIHPPQDGQPQSGQRAQSQQPGGVDDGNELPPPSAMRQAPQQTQQQPQAQAQPQQQSQPKQSQPQQSQGQAPQQPPSVQQQSQLKTPMPPTSLTALSSMSSTNLPEDANEKSQAEPQPPESNRQGDIRAQGSVPQSPKNEKDNKPQTKKASPDEKNPTFAKPKRPLLKYALFGVIGLVVLGGIAFAAMRFLGGGSTGSVSQQPGSGTGSAGGNDTGGRTAVPAEQTTIEYWGLWEPEGVMEEVIADFEEQNPGITVNYVKQSHRDYRERLQTAIASGNGPDLFRYHATWVPMLSDDLASLPSSVISTADFRQKYYSVASEQLQSGGQIVGIPAMYDGLALLYNQEIFTSAGEEPPQTWADVRTLANKLTVKSGDEITRAGIALGTSTNVDHFSDILAVLMLQNGADLSQPNSAYTRDALLFYTNFAKQDGVWNNRLPNSTVAFARGDVAMIFAPSWRIHEIIAMNENIDIGVAPLPLLGDEKIAWASYWAEGMSARSTKKDASGKFLQYLTSSEVLQKFYSAASEVRSFGEIYPQTGMANLLADDEYVAPYLQDAPNAEGWYLSSMTHDNGINDQLIKYYEDAVTAIINGEKDAEDVLTTIDQGTRQVLRQYNVSTQSN